MVRVNLHQTLGQINLTENSIHCKIMKKLLITLIFSGFTIAAFAQGTVAWIGSANLFIGQTNAGVFSPFFGGGSNGIMAQGPTVSSTATLYYYELLVSPTLTSVPTTIAGLASWQDTGLEAQNGNVGNGRLIQLNSGTAVVANNWPVGVTESLIMVGWSANLGTTWASALNYLENWPTIGVSGPTYFGVGSSVGSLASFSSNPGVVVLGTGTGQINNGASNPFQMDLLPVPEPGTMVLTALSSLSLLAFRRRK